MKYRNKKKFTDDEAEDIFLSHKCGEPVYSIAKRYGCSRGPIKRIINEHDRSLLNNSSTDSKYKQADEYEPSFHNLDLLPEDKERFIDVLKMRFKRVREVYKEDEKQ